MKLITSKRDRVLLYLLLLGLILGGGFYFLLRPAHASAQQLQTRLVEETALHREMQAAVARTAEAEAARDAARSTVAELSHTYYPPMASETIQEALVNLLDSHGITCDSIQVGSAGVGQVDASRPGSEGLMYPYRQYLISAGEAVQDGSVPAVEGIPAALLAVDVTAGFSAPTSSVLALLDDLAGRKAIQVSGYSIDTKAGSVQMNLVFTFYMLDQLS